MQIYKKKLTKKSGSRLNFYNISKLTLFDKNRCCFINSNLYFTILLVSIKLQKIDQKFVKNLP